MKITKIYARQILDSRGNPTVEAEVTLEDGSFGRSEVPSGASTGKHEALELRDNNPDLYEGKSVLKAVEYINTEIAELLKNTDVTEQAEIDQKLIDLDGTDNDSRLGANAILAVSLACAHAVAAHKKIPLFLHFNSLATDPVTPSMPQSMINILNGGRHANWVTDLQEYMIVPNAKYNMAKSLQIGAEIFHKLAEILKEQGYSTGVGDEGGYAPSVVNGNQEPLDLISQAVKEAGYLLGDDVSFALDAAASEFFEDGQYNLRTEGKKLSSDQMISWLKDLVEKYPITSLEDCLDQEDWDSWGKLNQELGDRVQIVGDDLFVTNMNFLEKGISNKSANTILVKLNQIGTLTETIKVIEMAHKAGWKTIVSHRSGETEDTTIAHLAVGLAAGQIKTGSLSRGERIAKYNELLRIEELLKHQ